MNICSLNESTNVFEDPMMLPVSSKIKETNSIFETFVRPEFTTYEVKRGLVVAVNTLPLNLI